MNKIIALGFLPLLTFTYSSAYSANTPDSLDHETVVVTANRTAVTTNESISSVLVFDEQDIQRSQARSISDFLNANSGLHFASNGGRGALSSLFIRGSNPNQVLVLIDGVKVGSATSGSVSYENFPLAQIERIEVVKGPRSSLYGSEAIGGIVQIFTKKGNKELSKRFSLSAGTQDTVLGDAGVRGQIGDLTYALGVSAEKTSGYDSCEAQAATQFGACFADDPDNDGYESLSGNLQLAYKLTSDTELSLLALDSENESEFDGGFQDRAESSQSVYSFGVASSLTPSWYIDTKFGQSKDLSDNYKGQQYSSTFDTTRDYLHIFNEVNLSSHSDVMLGVDYQRDEIESSVSYAVTERENFGYFSQYMYARDAHNFELSARYDDSEQFGAATTGSIGYGYQISQNLRFVSAFGTAFRAPTFNELYYPSYGTATLEPEKSRTTELGLRWSEASLRWAFAVYSTEVKNLIGLDAAYLPANLSEATLRGIDISVTKQHTEAFSTNLELGLVNALDSSGGANDGNRLQRRPPATAKLLFKYDQERWSHTLGYTVASGTYDDLANTKSIKAYRVVDVRTAYSITNEWRVGASVENVFDSHYQSAQFYNESPRVFMLTLSYQD